MTDNRTTELLHKLLIARGVEFDTDIDECCYDEPPKTTWDFVLCGLEMTVTATEFVDVEGKKYLEMDFHHAFTPEQAIAATLGSDDAFTREEVESAFVRGYSLGSLPVGSNPQWDENRQTVDEHMAEIGWVRAAKLGSEPCVIESTRYIESDIPDSWYEFDLSCGHTVKSEQVPPNYCDECGKRIDLQGVSYV